MATKYHNLTGSTGITTQLLAPKAGVSGVRSITITNIHASSSGTVSIFIQDSPTGSASSKFYLIRAVSIPVGATLLLDDPTMLNYDSSIYGLYAQVNSTDTIDLLINT